MKLIFGMLAVFALVLVGGISTVQAQEEDTAAMEAYIKSFATPEEAMQALQSEGAGESEVVEEATDENLEMYNIVQTEPENPTPENSVEETYGKEEKVAEEVVVTPPVEEETDDFSILLLTTILFGILAAVLGFMLYRVHTTKKEISTGSMGDMNNNNQVNL